MKLLGSSNMSKRITIVALFFAIACGDDDRGNPDGATPDGDFDMRLPAGLDADGDGISDEMEGRATNRDTDADGQPDYLDLDSDGDAISDELEAGPNGLMPLDSDTDGTPDYIDLDSDNNGIPDLLDSNLDENGVPQDTDGDTVADFRDNDDDGDFLTDVFELDGRTDFPRDTDDDGIPNYRDIDSDGDTISDQQESGSDFDGDGTPNYLDLDSDGDSLTDAQEAGDEDLTTPPVDTDEDRIPDFVDLDSDQDGLSDEYEAGIGSSPILADSDGDGVNDLIEVGGGTDVTDPEDSPLTRGNFVFTVPFRERPMPPRDTLRFRTNIRRADVYFLFDLTGSMIGEITAMRDAVTRIIEETTCNDTGTVCNSDAMCGNQEICSLDGTCIDDPEITGCIANVWTGAGYYAGGSSSYRNLLSVQPDPEVTRNAIPDRADGPGGAESLFESGACVSDPTVCFGALCGTSGVGCPAYRRDAVRVLALITDETNQCSDDPNSSSSDPPCLTVNSAGAAGGRLRLNRINFIGIDAASSNSPRDDLQAFATAAGSVNANGEPFYYEGDGSAVVGAVTEGIRELSEQLKLFVNIEASDVPGDGGDALQFIERLETNRTSMGCMTDAGTTDLDGDGYPDAYPSLQTGTQVCWDVIVRQNTRVRATENPQVFEAAITVFGDGSPLDRRRVFFLIPPEIEQPPVEF